MRSPRPLLELRDLRFAYPGEPRLALDRVSFRLEPGRRVAVVGPSGSGQVHPRPPAPALLGRPPGESPPRGPDARRGPPTACARRSPSPPSARTSSREPCARTSSSRLRAPARRSCAPPWPRPASTTWWCACRRGSTPGSASRGCSSRGASGSASPSRGPAAASALPPPRRAHRAPRRPHRARGAAGDRARRRGSGDPPRHAPPGGLEAFDEVLVLERGRVVERGRSTAHRRRVALRAPSGAPAGRPSRRRFRRRRGVATSARSPPPGRVREEVPSMLALTRLGVALPLLASGLLRPAPGRSRRPRSPSRPFVLHVSPPYERGRAGGPESLTASPTDGPLAKLQRARDFLREHRRGGPLPARRRRCAFRVAGTGCPSRSFSRRRTPGRPPGRPPPARSTCSERGRWTIDGWRAQTVWTADVSALLRAHAPFPSQCRERRAAAAAAPAEGGLLADRVGARPIPRRRPRQDPSSMGSTPSWPSQGTGGDPANRR